MDIYKIIGSLGAYSIVFFLVYIFYNIGKMSQIMSSKFLEEYDDKEILLKNAKANILKYDKTLIEPYIVMIPFFLFILVIYFISIFIALNFESKLSFLEERSITFLLFLICLLFYLVGELLFCYSENNVVRELHRIYYIRPWYLVFLFLIIIVICNFINNNTDINTKNKILEILGIITIQDTKVHNIFVLLSYLMTIFPLKWITRWIVLTDKDTYFDNLKNPNNKYISIVGIASMVLSILMILIIAYIALNYRIAYMAYGNIVIFIVILLLSSITAGQRAEFVIITRRFELYRKKIYYRCFDGKRKLFEK